MPYRNRFGAVDLLIKQLLPFDQPGTDQMVLSSMAGIIAVEAVTAYELAIKDIFEEFAKKKNKVFGVFVKASYERINGRIKYNDIKQSVKQFGDKYKNRLVAKMTLKTKEVLRKKGVDLVSKYDNLIEGRHQFVHKGGLTLTLSEAVDNYEIGKYLIAVLDETMKR